jgi:hypothetical protein
MCRRRRVSVQTRSLGLVLGLALLSLALLARPAAAHVGHPEHDLALAASGDATAGWSGVDQPVAALATAAAPPGHVLIFSETAAFRHTEAITQGTPKIQAALQAAGVTSEVSENSAIFNPADLERFDAIVMFQTSGDPWTGAGEKAALEAYMEAGNGIAAIHNATDMRGNFATRSSAP